MERVCDHANIKASLTLVTVSDYSESPVSSIIRLVQSSVMVKC